MSYSDHRRSTAASIGCLAAIAVVFYSIPSTIGHSDTQPVAVASIDDASLPDAVLHAPSSPVPRSSDAAWAVPSVLNRFPVEPVLGISILAPSHSSLALLGTRTDKPTSEVVNGSTTATATILIAQRVTRGPFRMIGGGFGCCGCLPILIIVALIVILLNRNRRR